MDHYLLLVLAVVHTVQCNMCAVTRSAVVAQV
jgi:hypothetical protein